MTNSNPVEKAPRRGPLRRLARLAVPIGALVALLILALPTILSTDRFRNGLVDEANRHLGGHVKLAQLELGWISAQQVVGLELWPHEPGEGAPLLFLPRARLEMDWLPLAFGGLGLRAEAENFVSSLVIHADGSTSVDDFLGLPPRDISGARSANAGQPSANSGTRSVTSGAQVPGFLSHPIEAPRLALDVALRGGSAALIDEGLGTTTNVRNVAITLVSRHYDDPITLEVTADVDQGAARFPFQLRASALGADDPGWTLALRTRVPQPGVSTGAVLAAVFPLLAGRGVEVRARVDLDVDLSGASLPRLLQGDFEDISGRVDVTISDGEIRGGLLGDLRAALARSGALGRDASGPTLLEFHGFTGSLVLLDGRAQVENAALVRGDGTTRPLPIEGWVGLDGSLHYRIPWTALATSKKAARLLGDRALIIEGSLEDPKVDWNLKDLAREALRDRAEEELDRRLKKGLKKLLGGKDR